MNYIGKFITNFREFYNEINSATLTGAIDVVVIQQPDGTYQCSPFHVRFGKIGVLRSREKVVDIEVNGNPIGIQMKLGESGEAFFVEGVPEDHEDLIPNYLATSPLPPATDIGAELEKMKLEVEFEMNCETLKGTEEIESELPKSIECIVVQSQDSKIDETMSNSLVKVADFVPIQNATVEDDSKPGQVELVVAEAPPLNSNQLDSENEEQLDESKVKRKRRKKSMIKRRPRNREIEAAIERDRSDSRESASTDQDRPLPSQPIKCDRRRGDSDEIFQMDVDDDHFEDQIIAPAPIRHISRSISMPLSHSLPSQRLGWRSKKLLSSTFAGEFHPFSDGDLTPVMSPRGSRPPSPKSDSEFERIKNDATCQTDHGEISWVWGELPNVPKKKDSGEWRKVADNNGQLVSFSEDVKVEGGDKRSVLGGVLSFMRTTKKMRHTPETEGIYLDDLNPDELDPEVAALYFPKYRSSRPLMYNNKDLKDEDAESGNGPSLPHSPHSVEGAIGGNLDSDSDERHSVFDFCSKHFTDLELSLCGGLQDYEGDIPQDRFLHFVVTYDDLCVNPSILQDPNLVIRMGGKFYNWQTAGPMLISLALFQRPLTEKAVGQLVTDYMPKKKKKSYSWWSWRRPPADSDMSKKDSNDPLSDQEQSGKFDSTPPVLRSISHEQVRILMEEERNAQSADSDNELDVERRPEVFKKSLTLSSDQISSLQLKDGANEVVFSVTTAFQGTTKCKCYIYLWNYDDKIIISDIDGTITKSDVLGHILPIIGQDWAQSGVAQLFTKIKSNSYQFLYLSARAIGQARVTKDYLRSVRQGDLCLPDGPLLLSPTSLISALHREVIEKKPEVFKINCLSNIQALFPKPVVGNPFYAGFGNKINDTWAYRAVEIPLTRIFTINHRGELKLELIQTFQSSYTRLSDVVDHVFPPLQRQKSLNGHLTTNFVAPEHYSSFTYWRMPMPTVTPSNSYEKSSEIAEVAAAVAKR